MIERVNVWGADIDNVTMEEALTRIDSLIIAGGSHLVVTPNVDHLVRLQRSSEFQKIYRQASLVLADGVPVMWAARLLGTPLKEKISGSDLFIRYCEHAAQSEVRLFFLGGEPGAAEKAKARLLLQHPHLKVVGTLCPPFGFENDKTQLAKIVDEIKNVKPDLLFVGLGSPKQENWLRDFLVETNVPVGIGVGVSFSFVAGLIKRAPYFLQRVGLEWAWRLLKEPRRLWRRYLIDGFPFAKYFITLVFRRFCKAVNS